MNEEPVLILVEDVSRVESVDIATHGSEGKLHEMEVDMTLENGPPLTLRLTPQDASKLAVGILARLKRPDAAEVDDAWWEKCVQEGLIREGYLDRVHTHPDSEVAR